MPETLIYVPVGVSRLPLMETDEMLISVRDFFLHWLGGSEMMWDVAFGVFIGMMIYAFFAFLVSLYKYYFGD